MQDVHPLLDRLVDYAGLYPPASLSMDDAVVEYARQREGGQARMLACFVVGASRLGELATAAERRVDAPVRDWPLSVLLGTDPVADLEVVRAFLAAHEGFARLSALEFRPDSVEILDRVMTVVPTGVPVYCELPWSEDPTPWLSALRDARAWAKIRTGGVTPELVPPVEAVARFVTACHRSGVGLKFTAGLHHPVRARHPLTYEPDAPVATMHGFLNVFVGVALFDAGKIDEAGLVDVLEETDPEAFELSADGGIRWRDRVLDADAVRDVRERCARSFGSCSFEEPVRDLRTLGMS